MSRRAIIVGSAGQDGTLLKHLLLSKQYEVLGVGRPGNAPPSGTADGMSVDIENSTAVSELISNTRPDEVYFLAAHHHSSEEDPGDEVELFRLSTEVHLTALVAFLEAVRRNCPRARLFYAASSHIFGSAPGSIQDESTPINPETIYGITKAAGLFACRRYRNIHGVFASVGILYNHESPLRNIRFVSKKIAAGVAAIKRGLSAKIVVGDLDASSDWGYAPDYVDAMHRMLQLETADDFIVATGESHTVREFAEAAFAYAGLDYRRFVETDPALVQRRMPRLAGNPSKFFAASGWRPSLGFRELVQRLAQHELDELQRIP